MAHALTLSRQGRHVLVTLLAGSVVAGLSLGSAGCGSTKTKSQTDAGGVHTIIGNAEGKVSYCHDGDTCVAKLSDGTSLTMRLAGIDAPEVSGGAGNKGQPMGKDARDFLSSMVKGKDVTIRMIEHDPYDRTVSEIFLDGDLVNIQLVQKGYAEAYKSATSAIDKPSYAQAEKSARSTSLGIWSLPNYESPSDFRHENN